jgi:dimethylargininase
MIHALTLTPSETMNETNCELAFMSPQPIDTRLALQQHIAYRRCLEDLGFEVTCLPANEKLPDGVFVEDPVVVLDEIAVLTMPFSPSRKGEVPHIEPTIAAHRRIKRIAAPGTFEGGDVLKIGRSLYVGLSGQTNEEGLEQFKSHVEPFGYTVVPVRTYGSLHLKTAVTALDESTLLMNPDWIDTSPFGRFDVVTVPKDEPFGANVITRGRRVLMHEGFIRTRMLVEARGFEVLALNISEFLKAEAGLTCMSVLFEEAR